MEKRVKRELFNVFAFDIESRNSEKDIANNSTSAWLCCMIDDKSKRDSPNIYFKTMEEWLDYLELLSRKKKGWTGNLLIYIFNLSFEWSFILPVLFRRGFEYVENIEKGDEFVFTSVTNKTCTSVWTASFKFGKKNGKIILRDLNKIFPGTLREVAKNFGLEMQKDDPIDYRAERPYGYEATDIEKHYIFNDVGVIIEILLKMSDDNEFWSNISSSSYSTAKMLRVGYPRSHTPLEIFRKDNQYPILDKEEAEFIAKSKAGGLTYVMPDWQFRDIIHPIKHIDVHQMYPSRLYSKLFPYGKGEYFTGKPPINKISCCHVRVSYSGVKVYSVIKTINMPIASNLELYLWDFEIVNMFDCYFDLVVEFIDGYAYKKKFLPWRKYYLDNYNKRLRAKKDGNAFLVMLYKLYNNSSYGKLIENPHLTFEENIINNDGLIDSETRIIEHPRAMAKYAYFPVGCCGTAYARVYLSQSALKIGYQYCLYFDTDSIFFLGTEEAIKNMYNNLSIDENLGSWGIEPDIVRGQFTAPKRYKLIEINKSGKEEFNAHTAGFQPFRVEGVGEKIGKDGVNQWEIKSKEKYEAFNIIQGKYEIQRARRAKGGTLIITQEKEMSVQEKYSYLYYNNIEE